MSLHLDQTNQIQMPNTLNPSIAEGEKQEQSISTHPRTRIDQKTSLLNNQNSAVSSQLAEHFHKSRPLITSSQQNYRKIHRKKLASSVVTSITRPVSSIGTHSL